MGRPVSHAESEVMMSDWGADVPMESFNDMIEKETCKLKGQGLKKIEKITQLMIPPADKVRKIELALEWVEVEIKKYKKSLRR